MYLTRNVSIIGKSEVLVMKFNVVVFAMFVEYFTNCHKQPHSSIVTFALQPIHL